MTTIVALETKGKVIFGSDTQATTGHTKFHLEGSKFFTTGPYVIGLAGLAVMIKVLQKAELPVANTSDPDGFMEEVFAPAVSDLQDKLFEKYNIPVEQGRQQYASSIIVGLKGRVYPIERIGDSEIFRNAAGIYTTGSGGEYAAAALVGRPKTEKSVLQALQAAADIDLYTSAPFHVKTFR